MDVWFETELPGSGPVMTQGFCPNRKNTMADLAYNIPPGSNGWSSSMGNLVQGSY